MVPRFYVERSGGCESSVYDRSTGDVIAECSEHVTAEIIASMLNNRVKFNEPLHSLSEKDMSHV